MDSAAQHPHDGLLTDFASADLTPNNQAQSASIWWDARVAGGVSRRSPAQAKAAAEPSSKGPDRTERPLIKPRKSRSPLPREAPRRPKPPRPIPAELANHPDYEVIRELGEGGMGVVYLAKNRLLDRQEVLKVIGRHLIEKPGVLDRFLREVRAAASLDHPNIVRAYSAVRAGESIVFAMEYIPGHNLADLVAGTGRLSVPHACLFTYQSAHWSSACAREGTGPSRYQAA